MEDWLQRPSRAAPTGCAMSPRGQGPGRRTPQGEGWPRSRWRPALSSEEHWREEAQIFVHIGLGCRRGLPQERRSQERNSDDEERRRQHHEERANKRRENDRRWDRSSLVRDSLQGVRAARQHRSSTQWRSPPRIPSLRGGFFVVESAWPEPTDSAGRRDLWEKKERARECGGLAVSRRQGRRLAGPGSGGRMLACSTQPGPPSRLPCAWTCVVAVADRPDNARWPFLRHSQGGPSLFWLSAIPGRCRPATPVWPLTTH